MKRICGSDTSFLWLTEMGRETTNTLLLFFNTFSSICTVLESFCFFFTFTPYVCTLISELFTSYIDKNMLVTFVFKDTNSVQRVKWSHLNCATVLLNIKVHHILEEDYF